ncbi:MAG: ABC transporter permease subunit [Candidatus Marinimicrobia bacterium]|nr:ABC transporter permease subunit [Candidatus Neomarinimicrobiota bacterium]
MTLLLKATWYEIIKIASKWRTYIGFITIAILVPVIMFLVRKYGFGVQDNALNSMKDSFMFVGSLVNGLIVSYFLMNVLWVHFPFFIVLVAGDVVSSEGAAGTFRIWLTRPISRFQVITAKFIATFVYTAAIVLFLGLLSVGLGMLIVGGGDLFVFDKGILILSQGEALYRFLIAYLLAVWVQMTVASLCFLFSSLTSNSVGPIIGTYATLVVMFILSVLKIDALKVIHPYLFTSYFDVFFAPFSDPIPWREIAGDVGKLGIFILVFYLASAISFIRKEITT